jgi:hypothetical protein
MEDWQEKIEAWSARVDEWNEGFHQEFRSLRRKRAGLFRRLSAADEEELAAEARRAAGEGFLVLLFGFLDELCSAYRETELPQDAAKLRAWVGEHTGLMGALWSYVEQAPELVRSADDGARLDLALAAVSLDDTRVDVEQQRAALGRLYIAASRAGIEPEPHFDSAAAVSNPGTGGGGSNTREALAEFRSSYYFREHVRPQLSRASA